MKDMCVGKNVEIRNKIRRYKVPRKITVRKEKELFKSKLL
jgi:hypothetical protein